MKTYNVRVVMSNTNWTCGWFTGEAIRRFIRRGYQVYGAPAEAIEGTD